MVDCLQFREDYSDFRDGLVSGARHVALEAHLGGCPACARYDRVIRKGAEVFREIPPVQPSDDFLPRLQHRLYLLDEELARPGRGPSGTPVPLMLAIAAAIATIAWLPLVRSRPPVLHLPAVTAHAPHHPPAVPVLFRTGPLLAPAFGPAVPAAEPLRLRHPVEDRYTLLPAHFSTPR